VLYLHTPDVYINAHTAIVSHTLTSHMQTIHINMTLPPQEPVDASIRKTVVGPSTGTLGDGDKPTFTFYIEISAAPGTVVRSPTLSDSMDPGLEVVGPITSSSNGAPQDRADAAIYTPLLLATALLPQQLRHLLSSVKLRSPCACCAAISFPRVYTTYT